MMMMMMMMVMMMIMVMMMMMVMMKTHLFNKWQMLWVWVGGLVCDLVGGSVAMYNCVCTLYNVQLILRFRTGSLGIATGPHAHDG